VEDLIVKKYCEDYVSLNYLCDEFKISQEKIREILSLKSVRVRTPGETQELQYFHKLKNKYFFKQIDTEEKAYWLGFITADGNVCKNIRYVGFGLHEKDWNHLQKFATIFGKVVYACGENKCGVAVGSKMFAQILVDKGVVPRKTYCDQSPILKNVPEKLYHVFVRGLMDGDGCVKLRELPSRALCFNLLGQYDLLKALMEVIPNAGDLIFEHFPEFHVTEIRSTKHLPSKEFLDWVYSDPCNVLLELFFYRVFILSTYRNF